MVELIVFDFLGGKINFFLTCHMLYGLSTPIREKIWFVTLTLGECGGVNVWGGVENCAFLLFLSALLHGCEIIAFLLCERVLRVMMWHKKVNDMYV